MNCCTDQILSCQSIPECFDLLSVAMPLEYTSDLATLHFSNGKGNILRLSELEVINGWVEINLEDESLGIPKGYFNQYGGFYSLQFMDNQNQAIDFFGLDNKVYNQVVFKVGGFQALEASINVFGRIPNSYLP